MVNLAMRQPDAANKFLKARAVYGDASEAVQGHVEQTCWMLVVVPAAPPGQRHVGPARRGRLILRQLGDGHGDGRLPAGGGPVGLEPGLARGQGDSRA